MYLGFFKMPKIKIDTSVGSIIWKIGKQNIWGCKLVSKKNILIYLKLLNINN